MLETKLLNMENNNYVPYLPCTCAQWIIFLQSLFTMCVHSEYHYETKILF